MVITGIKRVNENITLHTTTKIISFDLYKNDTPQLIITELINEGFIILNLDYLEKLLKLVLYTRFISVI